MPKSDSSLLRSSPALLAILFIAAATQPSSALAKKNKKSELNAPDVRSEVTSRKKRRTALDELMDDVRALDIGEVSPQALKRCADSGSDNRGSLWNHKGFFLVTLKSFARSACRPPTDPVKGAMTTPPRDRSLDGALYGRSGLLKTIKPNPADPQLLVTYMTVLHLGLRESGGHFGQGRDGDAGNTGVMEEAGICQSSFNVRDNLEKNARKGLKELEANFKGAVASDCFSTIIAKYPSMHESQAEKRQRQQAAKLKLGNPAANAREFRTALQRCPAFAVEHCAITLRQNRPHYGPLLSGAAPPFTGCADLLREIDANIKGKNQGSCIALEVPKNNTPTPKATTPARQAPERSVTQN